MNLLRSHMKIFRILFIVFTFLSIVVCSKKDYKSELEKRIFKAEQEIYGFKPDILNTKMYQDSLKLSDEDIIKLNIGFPAGHMILKKTNSDNLIFFKSVYTSEDLKPVMNYQLFGGEGTVRLMPEYFNIDWKKRRNLVFERFIGNKLWIYITDKIRVKINLEMGNVKAVLDFDSIILSQLKINQHRGIQVLKFPHKNRYRLNELSINLSEVVSLYGQNLANSNSLHTSITANEDLVYLDFSGELFKSIFVNLNIINAEARMLIPEKFGVKIIEYNGNTDDFIYKDMENRRGFIFSNNYDTVPRKIDFKINNTNGKIKIVPLKK